MSILIRHIFSDFRSCFARLFLLSGGSYLLTIALPFLMHDLFRSLDTEAFYGAALAVGVYFLCTPFYGRWASLRRRELGVGIRSSLDRFFYKTLQNASPAGRSTQGIVSLPFFESYSAQYSVLVFFPDLFWLALALCGFVAASIMQLGGEVTAAIAGACALYIVLSLRNVKVIGACYYRLLDIEKNRVGILSAVVKGFGAFSSGRFLPVVTKALAEVREEQRRWLTKRAWLQAWNETLNRSFFIVLFSGVILTLSHSAVDLDAVSLLVLSLCLNVLLNLLDDAISTIRVLYNVVLVDRKARRITGLTSRGSHNTPASDTLEGIVGITAKDSAKAKALLVQAAQDKALTIGGKSYALKGRIGYTNQTAFLVSGSIRDNILLEAGCSEDQLNAVLHRYQLLDDVAGFPEGIDKDVGAHGANLSTGQRVRVALARLDVQGYDTIILDDVFSSLNPAVSRAIQDIWRQEKQPNQTIVFMSSNASHYDWADVVIDCDSHEMVRQRHEAASADEVVSRDQSVGTTTQLRSTRQGTQSRVNTSAKTNTKPEKAGFYAFAAIRKFFGFGALALLVVLIGGEVFADIEIAKVLTEWRSTSTASFDHTVFYLLGLLAVSALATKNILVFFHGLARSQAIHCSHVGAVLGLSPQQFGRHDWGFYLNRLSNDFKAVEMTTPGFLAKLVFSVIATVAGTIFLVTLNPFLVALFVPLVAISSIVYRRYRQRVLSSTEAFAASRQPVISFVMETDERDLDIIASDLGGWARRRFAALVTARENAHKAYWRDAIAMDTVTSLFLNGVVVAVLVVVAVSHATGMYSAMSMLALFFVLSFRKEVGGLVGNLKSVETNLTALSRLDQVSPEALAGHGAAPMEIVQGDSRSLALEGITCAQGTEMVLEGFSARFEAGTPALVVGRTGCGKSTMLAAIHGDVALQAGKLTLTAPSRSPGSRPSAQVALVRPTSLSWDISVAELLALDGFGADTVAGFLRDGAEPGWLDALRGKNLSELSHGDRQLLELLRLLAQDPQVVLLDEAFTSLSAAMELRVLTALVRHYPQAVIIYVSHRPDNVADLFPNTLDMGG